MKWALWGGAIVFAIWIIGAAWFYFAGGGSSRTTRFEDMVIAGLWPLWFILRAIWG